MGRAGVDEKRIEIFGIEKNENPEEQGDDLMEIDDLLEGLPDSE